MALRRPRILRSDTVAASEPVGVVLLIAIAVILVSALGFAISRLTDDEVDLVRSGAKATYGTEGYWVEPTGPNDIPVNHSVLYIVINGGAQQPVPLSNFSAALGGAPVWGVGQRLCIVGPAASCWTASANSVAVTVYSRNNYVFTVEQLLSQDAPFIPPGSSGGGIVLTTHQSVRIDNVGSEITCGANGPIMDVVAAYTLDGGANWTNLFGGLPVQVDPTPDGSQNLTLPSVPVGAILGARAQALDSGTGCGDSPLYASVPAESHALVLRAGDPAPNKPPFGSQPGLLAAFLQPYVNTVTSTMVLDFNQVILLFEFTDDLGSSAADFQDLVILFTVG